MYRRFANRDIPGAACAIGIQSQSDTGSRSRPLACTAFAGVHRLWRLESSLWYNSKYSAFEQVRDGRKKKGKRYPLPLLLTLLLLGNLDGETTVNGIVDWIKERQGWLRLQLDWPMRYPTNSTYSEALERCDAQEIVKVIPGVCSKRERWNSVRRNPATCMQPNRKRRSPMWP